MVQRVLSGSRLTRDVYKRQTGNRACTERRVRQVKSGIFSLYPDRTPLCNHEVRYDNGWKDRCLYRRFQVGDWEEARHHVHEQRKKNTAIMVGIGTVLADDPMLNCRIEAVSYTHLVH